MINVLIVDDAEARPSMIAKMLRDSEDIGAIKVTIASFSNKARELISGNTYDILIIDVVLPRTQDGPLLEAEGVVLLEDILRRKDKYQMPLCIIGMSAHEDAATSASKAFMAKVHQFVPFTADIHDFLDLLKSRIADFCTARSNIHISTDNFRALVGVICALDVEIDALVRNGWNWRCFHDMSHRKFYETSVLAGGEQTSIVAVKPLRMGIVHTAIAGALLIERFKPKYLAMTGIAAAVPGKANIGDILFANPIWDWSVGKWEEDTSGTSFHQEPYQRQLKTDLNNKIEDFCSKDEYFLDIKKGWQGQSPDHQLRAHMGAFASGPSVIASDIVRDNITAQHRKVIGIDMEAFAVFELSEQADEPRPSAFTMKSVVDFANHMKSDSSHKYSCYTSAVAFKKFVEEYLC